MKIVVWTFQLRKILGFLRLYGLYRTAVKFVGRNRSKYAGYFGWIIRGPSERADISVIGCGQFSFSTICFFLYRNLGNRFLETYDPDLDRSDSMRRFWKFRDQSNDAEHLISNPHCTYVYIASNHSTHLAYAERALAAGKRVHIEKPLCTTFESLALLRGLVNQFGYRMTAGYNRPYAPANREAVPLIERNSPLMIQAHVCGHKIPKDHWYRAPDEGTRICGNTGHWIDLAVFLWNCKGSLGREFQIRLIPADPENPDDNYTLCIKNTSGELLTLSMFSLQEPVLGINEIIHLHQENLTVTIQDYRFMEIQTPDTWRKKSFKRKDVGHEECLMQIIRHQIRDWKELCISSELTLHVARMVVDREFEKRVIIQD